MRRLRNYVVCLVGLLLASTVEAQDSRRRSDPRRLFSIDVPSGWTEIPSVDGDYSQLALFSTGELDIAIVLACRPMAEADLELDSTDLLDSLIESTMSVTEALGNNVIQVGKIAPLLEPWPAFGAVAANEDKTLLMTVVRSPIDRQICNITTLTDNLQGSPELMETVARIVGTLRIEPPGAAASE